MTKLISTIRTWLVEEGRGRVKQVKTEFFSTFSDHLCRVNSEIL